MFWAAETHMVWNVKIVIGQSDTVPAHLVNQVFPENDDLLAAVLDPKKVKEKQTNNAVWIFKTKKPPKVWLPLQTYLHGFVVKTENGTLSLNSSVMWSISGGLRRRDSSTSGEDKWIAWCGADLPGQNGARTGVFRAGNKQKATTVGLRTTCWKQLRVNILKQFHRDLPVVDVGVGTYNIRKSLQWIYKNKNK